MLSFIIPKKTLTMNPILQNYCKKSTENYIEKIIDKYSLERKKIKLNEFNTDNTKNNQPEFNFYNILIFLSITTTAFYFYKKLH